MPIVEDWYSTVVKAGICRNGGAMKKKNRNTRMAPPSAPASGRLRTRFKLLLGRTCGPKAVVSAIVIVLTSPRSAGRARSSRPGAS